MFIMFIMFNMFDFARNKTKEKPTAALVKIEIEI